MTVSLRALRREEFESWYDHQRTWYAADLVETTVHMGKDLG